MVKSYLIFQVYELQSQRSINYNTYIDISAHAYNLVLKAINSSYG